MKFCEMAVAKLCYSFSCVNILVAVKVIFNIRHIHFGEIACTSSV